MFIGNLIPKHVLFVRNAWESLGTRSYTDPYSGILSPLFILQVMKRGNSLDRCHAEKGGHSYKHIHNVIIILNT